MEEGPAGPGGVVVLDTATRRMLRRIDTLAPGPHVVELATGALVERASGEPSAAPSVTGAVAGTFGDREVPTGRLAVWVGPSAAAMERVGSAEVGAMPLTLASSPDGGRAYVAAVAASTVSVVELADPARPTVLDTVFVPRAGEPGAHGLAYIPAP